MHWKVQKKAIGYENSKQINKQWLPKDGVYSKWYVGWLLVIVPSDKFSLILEMSSCLSRTENSALKVIKQWGLFKVKWDIHF